MEIGIDDLDFIDDEYVLNDEDTTTQDNDDQINNYSEQEDTYESDYEDDFIGSLLKSRGIQDRTRIKFENDEGEIEEFNWDNLSTEEKINILDSSKISNDPVLDDSELELINAIRSSKLTPIEYIQAVQNQGVDLYINSQNQSPTYRIDDITDDELFVTDMISRIPDLSQEEAIEALERAKSNETLFAKQMGALRSEYKRLEDERLRYDQMQREEEAQAKFDQFAEGIEQSIINFNEFGGYDLNMDKDDMSELYEFITGFDSAGNSHFGKALNHPPTLVKMAWFALHGEQMVNDINEYYKKEIANVRKESFNKGVQSLKDKPNVIHKPLQRVSKSNAFDDLDEF